MAKNTAPVETPVYLFLGFLESGKTKFIQETLEDERFDTGESTLLLVMEEGEEEYDESRFKVQNVHISYLNGQDELTEANLASLQEMYGATRVLVEYNGMWLLKDFFEAMPEGWMINQLMSFFDARTTLNFNANMRQLVFDKIENAQLVVFNRYSDEMDKMALHKLVRGISRRTDIVYERVTGKADFDNIEDPLPFDVNADVIVIEDKDYAYFYRDLTENLEDYIGKTVHFKGIVATDARLPEGNIVIGRHVMTCCEDDIAFSGLACVLPVKMPLKTRDWLEITAKIELKKHYVYKGKGPVLAVSEVKRCLPIEQALAVFY
ncbi:MAG: GTPase [Clostridiales bacterium]|nr:GTPase [Clostridiales bacterium]MBO5334342.1 GTPase [Clostridia bacterium]